MNYLAIAVAVAATAASAAPAPSPAPGAPTTPPTSEEYCILQLSSPPTVMCLTPNSPPTNAQAKVLDDLQSKLTKIKSVYQSERQPRNKAIGGASYTGSW